MNRPKYYVPRNLYITPPYYPQVPTAVLSSPHIFASLDVETLFYVFYYLPGSYQQSVIIGPEIILSLTKSRYLAARELKKQSWRFHVKYLTWFQRHSEPQAITDEYEQGELRSSLPLRTLLPVPISPSEPRCLRLFRLGR